MERKSHLIKPNRASRRPTRMLFVDTETWVSGWEEGLQRHTLRLGWACYWERPHGKQAERCDWYYFRDCTDFWQWAFRHIHPKTTLYLITHNLPFDFTVLNGFRELTREGYRCKSVYAAHSTAILRFEQGDRRLICLDNLNYFKVPLRVLGEEVGYSKGDVDPLGASSEELKWYCRQDVKILLETWRRYLAFLDAHDCGSFGPTISSQAFNCWAHRFNPEKVYIDAVGDDVRLARACYHGGRCEAYYIGEVPESPVYILDVNSMYPYVMRDNLYPTRRVHYLTSRVSPARLASLCSAYAVCARVVVQTGVPCLPALIDDKLCFPVGVFEACLATPEILLASRRAEILEVKEAVLYERADLFRAYVDYWHGLKSRYRAEGNTAYRELAKRMLNHLYGKFGQRRSDWAHVGTIGGDEVWTVEYGVDSATGLPMQWWYLGHDLYEVTPGEEAYNSHPAIAAHVTSFARAYLWELLERAGRENVFYCDTDSLFVNRAGYQALSGYLAEDALGKLALQRVIERLTVYGAKWYETDGELKHKGRRASDREIDPLTVEQEQWPGLSACLDFPEGVYVVHRTVKRFSPEYTKGIVEEGRVRPLSSEGALEGLF